MPAKRRGPEHEFNMDPVSLDQPDPKKWLSRPTKPTTRPHPTPKPKTTKLLTLTDGETMRDFSKRVDDTARTAINLAFKKTTKTKVKRTENSKSFKRGMREKARASDEDGLDQLLERNLQDKVKFGEQAMAPPIFTVKPTVKAYMPKPRDESDEEIDLDRDVKEKVKVKLTPAEKRIMEAEREKAILQYRLQKQRTIAIKIAIKIANYEKKGESKAGKRKLVEDE